jgi:hypothetical protein
MQFLEKKAMATYPDTNFGTSEKPKSESMVGEVKAKIGEMAEPLKDKAEKMAQEQKEVGTGHMRTLATAVHGAARELESGMPKIANAVHDVAHRIEQTADDLRTRSMDHLFEGFDRYARQQPAIVFGGALMAGFVLTRFLKSSAKPTSTQPMGTGEL